MQELASPRADSLRAALDSVFASPAYRWETREDPLGILRRAWQAASDYLTRLHSANPAAFRVLTWVLLAILAAILGHAAWIAFRTVGQGSRQSPGATHLPASTVRDGAWYAREAARLAQGGDFVAAMQADFLRLVLELDGRRLVTYHPSKTPSEYAREAALSVDARHSLRTLVREMYGYAFARVPIDRDAYERWRSAAATERYAAAH